MQTDFIRRQIIPRTVEQQSFDLNEYVKSLEWQNQNRIGYEIISQLIAGCVHIFNKDWILLHQDRSESPQRWNTEKNFRNFKNQLAHAIVINRAPAYRKRVSPQQRRRRISTWGCEPVQSRCFLSWECLASTLLHRCKLGTYRASHSFQMPSPAKTVRKESRLLKMTPALKKNSYRTENKSTTTRDFNFSLDTPLHSARNNNPSACSNITRNH